MAKQSKLNAYSLYLFISAASALGINTVWTVSGVYQVEIVRLNPLQLVLVGTVLELVTFFLQVPTGALADLYSRRLCITIGYSLVGISYLFQGLVPRFEAILLSQVLLAAGFAFVVGAEEAWITSEIGEEQAGKAFLRSTQWGLAGALVAVPLGLTLANRFQFNTPMIVGAGILLLLGTFLLFFMPENNFRPVPKGEQNSWQMLGQQMTDGGKVVRTSPMLLCVLGATLFIALASEGFDRLDTAHFLQDFTLPSLWGLKPVTWIGLISFGSTVLGLGATEIVKRFVDTSRPRTVIGSLFVLQFLAIASVVAFGLVGNFYMAVVAYWCARVIGTLRNPLLGTWITQHTDAKQRATIFSFAGTVDPIGQIAGGPLVGAIGVRFSLRAAMIAVSLIMSPTLLFLGRALGLSKRTPIMAEEEKVEEIRESETRLVP